MAESISFSRVYSAYFKNQPYIFPSSYYTTYTEDKYTINTGYHVLPTMLFRHFMTQGDWAHLQINYQAYQVTGYDVSLFNLIPMTTMLSFGQTQAFTQFNNCIYAIGYQDEHYETGWENWYAEEKYNPVLAQTEGTYITDQNSTVRRYEFPIYQHKLPNYRLHSRWTAGNSEADASATWPAQGRPNGCIWNPMNCPNKILEYRPGKNAINFSWRVHECDKDKWFNLDAEAHWHPYTPYGPYMGRNRPATGKLTTEDDPDVLTSQYENTTPVNDYTWPNYFNCPIVPCAWWWHEMKNSIVQDFNQLKPDLFFPGTEYAQYKYPPAQCFVKGIPLFDDNNTLVNVTMQTSVKVTLHMNVKPRKSAYFAPTWGPFGYPHLYTISDKYSTFRPAIARIRTGGARTGWQNLLKRPLGSGTSENWKQAHAREDPYDYNITSNAFNLKTNPGGTGVDGTRSMITTIAQPKSQFQVTFTNDPDEPRVVIDTSPISKLFTRGKSPEPMH
nr:MAG: capsid protein [Protoparvovirus sp.]